MLPLRWPVSEFNSISTVLVSCCYNKIPEVVGLWARLCLGSQLQRFQVVVIWACDRAVRHGRECVAEEAAHLVMTGKQN